MSLFHPSVSYLWLFIFLRGSKRLLKQIFCTRNLQGETTVIKKYANTHSLRKTFKGCACEGFPPSWFSHLPLKDGKAGVCRLGLLPLVVHAALQHRRGGADAVLLTVLDLGPALHVFHDLQHIGERYFPASFNTAEGSVSSVTANSALLWLRRGSLAFLPCLSSTGRPRLFFRKLLSECRRPLERRRLQPGPAGQWPVDAQRASWVPEGRPLRGWTEWPGLQPSCRLVGPR